MTSKSKQFNISLLNLDSLLHIFHFLEPLHDIFSTLTRVCKQWHHLICHQPNNGLFQHLCFFETRGDLAQGRPMSTCEGRHRYTLRRQALKVLFTQILPETNTHPKTLFYDFSQEFLGINAFSSFLLESVIRRKLLDHIQQLALPISKENYDDELVSSALQQACNTIRHVSISTTYGPLATKTLLEVCGPQLESIHFSSDGSLDKNTVNQSQFQLSNLTTIIIDQCLDYDISAHLIESAPNLKHFHQPYAGSWGDKSPPLDVLASCPLLESCSLGTQDSESGVIPNLDEFTSQPKYLRIGFGDLLTEELEPFDFGRLETLIHESDFLENECDILESLKEIGRNVKHLEIQKARLWHNIDEMIDFCKTYLPNLEKVDISDFTDSISTYPILVKQMESDGEDDEDEDEEGEKEDNDDDEDDDEEDDEDEKKFKESYWKPLHQIFDQLSNLNLLMATVPNQFNLDKALGDKGIEFQFRENLVHSLIMDYEIIPLESNYNKPRIKISHMFDERTLRVYCQNYKFDLISIESNGDNFRFSVTKPIRKSS